MNFYIFCFFLAAGPGAVSSLKILNKHLDCNKEGIFNCSTGRCLDVYPPVSRERAPTGPSSFLDLIEHTLFPVVKVTWEIKADGSFSALQGTEIRIVDENANKSFCVQFSYRLQSLMGPNFQKWSFSLELQAEPRNTYSVTVFNLPEPKSGTRRTKREIHIPGCDDERIKRVAACQENGSLWDPNMSVFTSGNQKLFIVVSFGSARYAETYQVLLQNDGFSCSSNISKKNRTALNVTFEVDSWQLTKPETLVIVQAFFLRCKNDCRKFQKFYKLHDMTSQHARTVKLCIGFLLALIGCLSCMLWRTSHQGPQNTATSSNDVQPEVTQVQQRRRVFIIYSPDHPLYKNIVLKFCSFLMSKCGTEVVLDLLDTTRLAVMGSVQWLDWHKEQIENSSDKILVLCSRGVQAKWRAVCGGKQVFLRGDACSVAGDLLTPFFALVLPRFVRSASFKNYIIAFFDDVCSEEDIPSPLNVTIRYRLMKQFEEVFFRVLDTEKHEPGRVKQIEGLSEDKYHSCPSGRALRNAMEAFRNYQMEHPCWFEDEQLECSTMEMKSEQKSQHLAKTNHVMYSLLDSTQYLNHVEPTEEDATAYQTNLSLVKKHKMPVTLEYNSNTVESTHLLL